MGERCVLAEQRSKRTGGLGEPGEMGEPPRSSQETEQISLSWLYSCKVHLLCIFSTRTVFSKRSASESSQSDQLITKCCQNTSWRIFANAVFPCLGRFHLELPQYLRSFLECGKEVWWHQKRSSSAWRIHRFREHSSPGSRSQLVTSPKTPPQRAPFWNRQTNICWQNVKSRRWSVPTMKWAHCSSSWWISTAQPGLGTDAVWTGHDLEQQQEVRHLLPGQVCECARPVWFSKICDYFPKTPKAPKYLAGSVSVA